MEAITVYWEACREGARLPRYAHPGDAGMDVYAAEAVTLQPGETRLVPLGFKVALPPGYELQIRARSGLSLHTRLRLANGLGTIDAGYRGEVAVPLYNSSSPADLFFTDSLLDCHERDNRAGTYHIAQGDRIAQIVLARVPQIAWMPCEGIEQIGEDRGGGFGHSGV